MALMKARRMKPERPRPRPGGGGTAAGAGLLAAALSFLGAPGVLEGAEKKKKEKAAEETASPETELKEAVKAGEIEKAKQLVDDLAAAGGPAAYRTIIKYALTGASYELEKHAGAALARSEDPAVHALILEDLSASRNFKTRIILLALAARRPSDAGALESIHAALKDPARQVVFAALHWIRELKREESIAVLVAELEEREKKPRDRIYHDVLKALHNLTGLDLVPAADWKNFVAARKQGIPPPVKKESDTVVYTKPKPKFFGMDLQTDKVLFIIDKSGSMLKKDPPLETEDLAGAKDPDAGKTVVVKKGAAATPPPEETLPITRERMTRVRTELMNAVRLLPETTRFGILAFSHELEFWGGARTLRNATAENRASALNWIRALRADGATRTDQALREGLSIIDLDTIFLLTDGAPQRADGELVNGQVADREIPIEPILDEVRAMNRFLRARIHTVSFAQIRDKDMRRFVLDLARANDGECKFLP